jgi:uncharacterized membrane-anchored protein
MNYRRLIFPGFILMVLVQLYVPAKMILDREDIINSGVTYKFKTAPLDPYDPFRGKYIRLRFNRESIQVDTTLDWFMGEQVYATLSTDKDGFAKVKSLSKRTPANTSDFLKVEVRYPPYKTDRISINYPFDRFYMEESKAYDAEVIARKARIDTTQLIYALVNIKDGDSVLRDVLIDDVPIQEVVKANQESTNNN